MELYYTYLAQQSTEKDVKGTLMMKRLLLSSMLLTCVTLTVVIMTARAPVTPQAEPTPPAATAKTLDADEKRYITVLCGDCLLYTSPSPRDS